MSGCGNPEQDFLGTWEGQRSLPNSDQMPEPVRNTLQKVSLSIQPGARFTLTEFGLGYTGRVVFEGQTAKLFPETLLERPIGKGRGNEQRAENPYVVRSLPGGKLELSDPTGAYPEPVSLNRVAQKD